MPKAPALDPRGAQDFSFDVEVDRKVQENVAEDVAQNLAQIDPFMAEEVQRQADWARQTQIQETLRPTEESPTPQAAEPAPAQEPAPDRLAQLEAELAEKHAALEQSNKELGRLQNKFGDERRRTAERLARLETMSGGGGYAPTQHAPSPAGYDPRILGDVDPNAPLTAAQTAMLMQSMASAFGSQLSAREKSIIEASRGLRNYDLTSDEEADLLERHGWLAALEPSAQIRAMGDLVKPLRAASQPAAAPAPPPKPQGVSPVEVARARHLAATTFIEPSSRGTVQESNAVAGVDSGLAKKIAEYRTLMAQPYGTPGVSEKAEGLLKEISALQRRR